jgi:hypothetical protein
MRKAELGMGNVECGRRKLEGSLKGGTALCLS